MARGFNPEISSRLDQAGYKLAVDPTFSADPYQNYPATAVNPNYTVDDPGGRDNMCPPCPHCGGTLGHTAECYQAGPFKSKFPGLGKKIRKASKSKSKKSKSKK
jgi:hypothetical protein